MDGVLVTGVDLAGGSFFFGGGCGLGSLSEESESLLLSVDNDDTDSPDAELLELAELSDLTIDLVSGTKNC